MANFSYLCVRCMQPLTDGDTVCPRCGDDSALANPPHVLPCGTLLAERYMVGRLLKDGGDASVYAGYDTVLKAPITLREFFPQTLCEREETLALRAIRGCEQTCADYMNKFLAHARVVARMRDLPASIPMYDIFRENETAYTVSEVCDGITLTEYLNQHGGRISWDEARPLFIPLMNSLDSLHRAGVLHLGLNPDALIVGRDDKLHIADFAISEARAADSELTAELLSGYAAPEQYVSGAGCSSASDVYGLAAVIFRALVGSPPPDGETRPKNNSDLTVPSEVADEFPPHVASALFNALQPAADSRLTSIAVLRDRLAEAPAVAALLIDEPDEETVVAEEEEPEYEPTGAPIAIYIVIGIIACILLALLGFALGRITAPSAPDADEPTSATTTKPSGIFVYTEDEDPSKPAVMASVPNLVGMNYDVLRGTEQEGRLVKLGGYQFSNQPAGTIIAQSPTSEEEAPVSAAIHVMVSAGPEAIAIPNLSGWEAAHAEEYLKGLGFKVQILEVKVSTVQEGHVVATDPPAGTPRVRGTTVTLRVNRTEGGNTTTPPSTTTTTTTTSTTTTTTTTTTTKPTTTTGEATTTTGTPTTTTGESTTTTGTPTTTTGETTTTTGTPTTTTGEPTTTTGTIVSE